MDERKSRIIAAVRREEDLKIALETGVTTIFLLNTNIEIFERQAEITKKAGRKLYVHLDFAEGVGKDSYGIRFLKDLGADGIITTKPSAVKQAKEEKIPVVQRFFMVDSRSVDTAIDSVRTLRPDMVELMPAIAYKTIEKLSKNISVPVIAGGLAQTEEEIRSAIEAGAFAVSTGEKKLWNLQIV